MKLSLPRALMLAFAWLVTAVAHVSAAQTPAPAGTQTLSPDRVTFYTEPNYRGDALAVEAGASVPDLERTLRTNGQPWSFAISSIKVEGSAKAIVYSGIGFNADRLEVSRSIPDLYAEARGREPGATWDRAIMSLSVTGPARTIAAPGPQPYERTPPPPTTVVVVQQPPPRMVAPPPPPRVMMDLRTADMIIHRAFREVLGRNADPDGLRTYRERLLRDGWNEQQIIEQLQRSKEARGVNADEAIHKAYREVLGRDADPNGLAHYRAKWRDGWTQGQIRDDLRRSHEGRNNHIQGAITKAYRELLGRDPDPQGFAHFEKAMRERGWTERDVRQNIMQGDEYKQRRGKK
jgi:hypothetical protein